MKAEHSQDDAIVDDIAGQAYVEQFGLETFQRGQNAMSSNKVTKYDRHSGLKRNFLIILQTDC